MVELWLSDVFLIDTSLVSLLKLVSSLDTARDWAVLVDISLHLS